MKTMDLLRVITNSVEGLKSITDCNLKKSYFIHEAQKYSYACVTNKNLFFVSSTFYDECTHLELRAELGRNATKHEEEWRGATGVVVGL